jgi:hypothetical protein
MKLLRVLTVAVFFSALCAQAQVPNFKVDASGQLLKDGKPFRALGINYFSCFGRTLENGNDTSYDDGFQVLAGYGIPFARFAATGFWPKDMALYQTDREAYFRRLDAVVASAEKHDVGLIPSLFWYFACVPDLVGEPMDQWGNPKSKTHAWMRTYVREVVTRYRNSPAIWAWEMGNEFSLQASLPNASEHRARIVPGRGTAPSRSERDDVTFNHFRLAFEEFAKAVREHDPSRIIFTGDALPRPAAFHMEKEGTWTPDSEQQFRKMLQNLNPDPINAISVHAYGEDVERIGWSVRAAKLIKKPLFVGEFGVPGTSAEVEKDFRQMLKLIEESDTPLAALWVFDLPSQDADYNITATNARAYQLKELGAANARVQKEGGSRIRP